jgi:hypothetical protein
MRIDDLHILPKFRDSLGCLYVEHCRVDREEGAIAIHDAAGVVPVPCAGLAVLMLGPGVSITHAAVLTLADCGCLIAWCGEQGVRLYASGIGKPAPPPTSSDRSASGQTPSAAKKSSAACTGCDSEANCRKDCPSARSEAWRESG